MKPPFALPPAEAAHCEALIRRHSLSFHAASKLLPKGVREASWALYAFCRAADDAIDEARSPEEAQEALRHHRARLQALHAGEAPQDLREAAFARFLHGLDLPLALPEALLDGVGSDIEAVRVASWEELTAYSFKVASTVGLMMTRAMGVDHPEAHLRAAELGVAMQLTNIARDVVADAAMGRVYLPAELLEGLGTSQAAVLAGEAGEALPFAVAALLKRAEAHYAAGLAGVPYLPWSCRPAIAAARTVYGAIGQVLAAQGHDPRRGRASTSRAHKLREVARALAWVATHPRPLAAPPRGPQEAQLRQLIRKVGLNVDGPPEAPRGHEGHGRLQPSHGLAMRPEG